MKIIQAKNLKKYYTRGSEVVKALDSIDFDIESGEIVSIVGPSGSGKTTLMNLISCLDNATDGHLTINGKDVTTLDELGLNNIRRSSIGFIFQQFYLIETLTVKENVELPLIFSKHVIDQNKIKTILSKVGLEEKDKMSINMLNGGDKQRVAIARALINDPRIIIADEPTGRLETSARDSLLNVFDDLRKTGLSIFIATHDLELASKTDRILFLQDGKLVNKKDSTLYV